VARWNFLEAFDERDERLGGAIVVTAPRGIIEVGGRPDYAVLWDLRVRPDRRRQGVGRALLEASMNAAGAAGRHGIDVETQDVNAGACRLYAANGFVLSTVEPGAYSDAPDEARLIWTRESATGAR
jgi:ribosomal protein S18 acetylase RimI-like enzyme